MEANDFIEAGPEAEFELTLTKKHILMIGSLIDLYVRTAMVNAPELEQNDDVLLNVLDEIESLGDLTASISRSIGLPDEPEFDSVMREINTIREEIGRNS